MKRKVNIPVRRSARLQNIPQILLLCILSLLIALLLSETPFIPDIDILTISITNEMNKDYSRSINSNEWQANNKLLENCREKIFELKHFGLNQMEKIKEFKKTL